MRTIETCGGDDVSYQVPLTTTVSFNGQTFTSVYATTNSVITFGNPDGTYWTYPQTPSISLYSMDWLVYPNYHQDEHLIIQTSDGGFRVDISARPIWLYDTDLPTSIIITAAINADGTVAISYATNGPLYENNTRTGVRLIDGSVVTLAQYGVVKAEKAVDLTPAPVTPPPTTPPTTDDTTRPTEPVNPPSQPEVPVNEPESSPEPEPAPTEEPAPAPAPAPESTQEPVPVQPEPSPEPEPVLPMPEPTKDPTALELAQEAQADDPQLDPAIAAIPLLGEALGAILDVFNDVGNIGADMTPEVRQQAQETVVASVIVGQVASSAAAAAASASAASTRKNK